MTERKEHPHADLYKAAAEHKVDDFEAQYVGWQKSDTWENASNRLSGIYQNPDLWKTRRKQKMHRIGEHTFPEPMTQAPAFNSTYWVAKYDRAERDQWDSTASEIEFLNAGVCHTTREAAEAHSKALAAIARGKPV